MSERFEHKSCEKKESPVSRPLFSLRSSPCTPPTTKHAAVDKMSVGDFRGFPTIVDKKIIVKPHLGNGEGLTPKPLTEFCTTPSFELSGKRIFVVDGSDDSSCDKKLKITQHNLSASLLESQINSKESNAVQESSEGTNGTNKFAHSLCSNEIQSSLSSSLSLIPPHRKRQKTSKPLHIAKVPKINLDTSRANLIRFTDDSDEENESRKANPSIVKPPTDGAGDKVSSGLSQQLICSSCQNLCQNVIERIPPQVLPVIKLKKDPLAERDVIPVRANDILKSILTKMMYSGSVAELNKGHAPESRTQEVVLPSFGPEKAVNPSVSLSLESSLGTVNQLKNYSLASAASTICVSNSVGSIATSATTCTISLPSTPTISLTRPAQASQPYTIPQFNFGVNSPVSFTTNVTSISSAVPLKTSSTNSPSIFSNLCLVNTSTPLSLSTNLGLATSLSSNQTSSLPTTIPDPSNMFKPPGNVNTPSVNLFQFVCNASITSSVPTPGINTTASSTPSSISLPVSFVSSSNVTTTGMPLFGMTNVFGGEKTEPGNVGSHAPVLSSSTASKTHENSSKPIFGGDIFNAGKSTFGPPVFGAQNPPAFGTFTSTSATSLFSGGNQVPSFGLGSKPFTEPAKTSASVTTTQSNLFSSSSPTAKPGGFAFSLNTASTPAFGTTTTSQPFGQSAGFSSGASNAVPTSLPFAALNPQPSGSNPVMTFGSSATSVTDTVGFGTSTTLSAPCAAPAFNFSSGANKQQGFVFGSPANKPFQFNQQPTIPTFSSAAPFNPPQSTFQFNATPQGTLSQPGLVGQMFSIGSGGSSSSSRNNRDYRKRR